MSKIVVFGDAHGKQNELYARAQELGADTILQVGDFETIRKEEDLKFFPAPPRFRKVKDFKDFYQRGSVPIKTFFIGGNHEAFNVLEPFPNGGQILENLYYLGRVGVVEIDGLKIGGISGIYSGKKFHGQRKPELNSSDRRYFTLEDFHKIADMKLDVLLMHDWIFRSKFGDDGEITVESSRPEIEECIRKASPRYVFCGHVHYSYRHVLEGSQVVCLSELEPYPFKK